MADATKAPNNIKVVCGDLGFVITAEEIEDGLLAPLIEGRLNELKQPMGVPLPLQQAAKHRWSAGEGWN